MSICSSKPQLDVAGGAHPREPRTDVISSSGGAGGVLQPPQPPLAPIASKWEKILKSMSQFIPYLSVSSRRYPCKLQQTEIQTAGTGSSALGGAVETTQRKL